MNTGSIPEENNCYMKCHYNENNNMTDATENLKTVLTAPTNDLESASNKGQHNSHDVYRPLIERAKFQHQFLISFDLE